MASKVQKGSLPGSGLVNQFKQLLKGALKLEIFLMWARGFEPNWADLLAFAKFHRAPGKGPLRRHRGVLGTNNFGGGGPWEKEGGNKRRARGNKGGPKKEHGGHTRERGERKRG